MPSSKGGRVAAVAALRIVCVSTKVICKSKMFRDDVETMLVRVCGKCFFGVRILKHHL